MQLLGKVERVTKDPGTNTFSKAGIIWMWRRTTASPGALFVTTATFSGPHILASITSVHEKKWQLPFFVILGIFSIEFVL